MTVYFVWNLQRVAYPPGDNNSAFCGFAATIKTLPHAISLLGTRQVHDLVLATSVTRSFSKIPKDVVDMRRFWRTSVLCGTQAKLFAEHCGILDNEHMFTTGLLAHVGRLVMYLQLPGAMHDAYATASEEGIALSQVLEAELGFDDAAVAGELLSAWKLPECLVGPVSARGKPGDCQETDRLSATILRVASAVADTHDVEVDADELIRRLDDFAWIALELNRETLLRLKTGAEELASDIEEQFLPEAV